MIQYTYLTYYKKYHNLDKNLLMAYPRVHSKLLILQLCYNNMYGKDMASVGQHQVRMISGIP
jgi:hypothetical protein